MKHLTEGELVDHLDGTLSADRSAHLEHCRRCRVEADSLRDGALVLSTASDVPEPSPLFWQHFSERVHDAVQNDDVAVTARWLDPRRIAWAISCAAVLIAAAGLWWMRPLERVAPHASPSAAIERAPVPAIDDLRSDPDADENWALVRMVADDLRWEDAQEAGVSAQPGSAEGVALEMSQAERQELARLIEDEMKRTGA